MPSPSHSGSRRSSGAKPVSSKTPRSRAKKPAPGSADFAEKAPSRSSKAPRGKAKKGGTSWLVWLGAGAISVVLLGATLGVWSEYRATKARVAARREVLVDLEKQAQNGRQRLKALSNKGGREQLLLENGYIRPGERLLLFPRTAEEQRQALQPKNDLSPHTKTDSNPSGSTWQSAGAVLRGWWNGLIDR